MNSATVKVVFHQDGTWGGIQMKGVLAYEEDPLFGIRPVLTLTTPGWEGLKVYGREKIPGKCADMFFLGDLSAGKHATALKRKVSTPSVFCSSVSYLHIDEEGECTSEQRQLVMDAICIRKAAGNNQSWYPSGASLQKWASVRKSDYEAEAERPVYYA